MICPYCKKEAPCVDSSIIYGRSYGNVYLCEDCDAYVGCHKGTKKPLGTLANRELREWRKKAHAEFDPLWKGGRMKRSQAYAWLKKSLNSEKDIHIGESDIELCQKIVELINAQKVPVEFLNDTF